MSFGDISFSLLITKLFKQKKIDHAIVVKEDKVEIVQARQEIKEDPLHNLRVRYEAIKNRSLSRIIGR